MLHMNLSYVQICNYRSVEFARLDFTPSCRVLVGLNESGKSNILRALSLLDENRMPGSGDIRIALPDEPQIEKAYVRFVFTLDDAEMSEVYKRVLQKVLCHNPDAPMLKRHMMPLTLRDFCKTRREGVREVNIIDSVRSTSYWGLSEKHEVMPNWKKPSPDAPETMRVGPPGAELPILAYKIINTDDYGGIPPAYLLDADARDINQMVGDEIVRYVKAGIPQVVFWEYADANLLPAGVRIEDFAADPNICSPLKSMFQLAGITEIGAEISREARRGRHGIRNLLNRVAEQTTRHFREMWPEYRHLEFGLSPNGDSIDASIKDVFNHYEMSQRSDGFKRFATFLLTVSARLRTNQLKGALLLIDEPDVSLHPSGAKFLRDELLRIAEQNFVVYSTHSIFMIDTLDIGKHIIVKKINEKTSVSTAESSTVPDEDVLYHAVNLSVFEGA